MTSSAIAMSLMCFPPELCDYAIDFLHDDKASLKSCSLTCKSWLPSSRFHLFGRVSIHSQKACDTLHNLFIHSPQIGKMVQSLDISSFTVPNTTGPTPQGRPEGLIVVPSSLFSCLPDIRNLVVSVVVMEPKILHQCTENFKSVVDLTLQGCFFASLDQLADCLQSFPRLQNLSLSDVRWGSTELDQSLLQPLKLPNLRALSLGKGLDVSSLADWFLSEEVFTHLTSLSACCSSDQDVIALGDLLKEAVDLQYCELFWYGFSTNDIIDLPSTFSLKACTSLKSINLRCPVMYCQSLPWITTLLTRLPAESIESVLIELRLLGAVESIDWSHMGQQLSGSTFRRLSTVKINAITWSSVHQRPKEVQSFIHSHLSALQQRDILHVTAS